MKTIWRWVAAGRMPVVYAVQAMMYGLPPTAGWGMGVDRLCMLLSGQFARCGARSQHYVVCVVFADCVFVQIVITFGMSSFFR